MKSVRVIAFSIASLLWLELVMDEEAIEKELNCSICLDTYTDPKILQCFHVYCQKCLVRLVIRDQQGQLSLSCPICRQVTPVPASGTAGLQSAFHINRLLELVNKHKEAKDASASAEKVDSKAESPSPHKSSAIFCSEHDGREVELFCETCEQLLCLKCVIKGGKHHSHDYKDINEAFERYKEEVTPSLEPMEKQMTTIAKVLMQLNRHCDEITHQQAAIEAEIRDSSMRLHKIVENRQKELISQLDQITRRKLKSLATQKDQIETLQAQLGSCLEFTRESLKTGIQQHEVLVMKTDILKQVRELTTASKPNIFTLSTEADVMFSASADAAAMCKNHGRVYALDSPDPSACVATGRGTEEAVVGEKATAALNVVSFKGEPCDAVNEVELVSEITGSKVAGSIERSMERRGQGQYVINYQPTVKGRHQLHIKADSQHIRGSPFSVAVKLPVEKLGTPIQTVSGVLVPIGVAINGKGEVVVAEWEARCVSVFSPCGKKLRSFGTHGSGEGQFQKPTGVAVDGEGNLIIADYGNHRIQKFTADGHFLEAVGSKGRGPLQFSFPCGIAYSASNKKVYVADTGNNRIQILNSDLQFGRRSTGKGLFHTFCGVAIDSTGTVYVADAINHRIQVLTADGKFLRLFGRRGAGRGELDLPYGIAVDASGLVYVSELNNNRVSVFTSEGGFVTSFGRRGSGPGQFNDPRGLAVDSSGVVYVCDSKNDRLQIFDNFDYKKLVIVNRSL